MTGVELLRGHLPGLLEPSQLVQGVVHGRKEQENQAVKHGRTGTHCSITRPGNSSTGGLPTFTHVPPTTWVSSGAPLPVAAPMPVSVTQNAQSFTPYTPQTHTNIHVSPVVTSCVSVPHPVPSHAIHAQTHVPSSVDMPAPVSMPVTTNFTHPTHTVPAMPVPLPISVPVTSMNPCASVFQPAQLHAQPSVPIQPGLPVHAQYAVAAFHHSLPAPWNVLPRPGTGPSFKDNRKLPGFISKFDGKKSYTSWRRLFIACVLRVEVPVDQKIQVMIASLDQDDCKGPAL